MSLPPTHAGPDFAAPGVATWHVLDDPSPAPVPRPEVVATEPAAPSVPQNYGAAMGDLALNRPGVSLRQMDEAELAALPPTKPRHWLVRLFLGPARRPTTPWGIGAVGEELVGVELDRLVARDPRSRLLHSVPVGKRDADIDHVVIGPGGVFTLNTKHHNDARIWVSPKVFMVNGQRTDYLRSSRHEAARASKLLTRAAGCEVLVRPLIVPVNARSLTIREQPSDVQIVSRKRVAKYLRKRRTVLDDAQVALIHEVARRPEVWRG